MPTWQRALVTGASSGIGEAFAERLAGDGTDLVVVARGADDLDAVADGLRRRHGITVEVLPADLVDDDGRAIVAGRLAADERPVDLLVNNAGVTASGAFHDADLDRQLRQIELNVSALVALTHAALPGMRARGRGAVLNVSSLTAYQPYPYGAVYGATKAFVNSFSVAVHTEVAPDGVSVLAVCPGFTRTNLQTSAGISRTPVPDRLWLQPDDVARDGLAALDRGRALRVVGVPYRAWAAAMRVVPGGWAAKLIARGARHRT